MFANGSQLATMLGYSHKKKGRALKSLTLMVLLVAALASSLAKADTGEHPAERADSRWAIDVTFMSHHFGYDRGFNEFNPGLGVTYNLREDVSLLAGFYKNSYGVTTSYVGGLWLPVVAFDGKLKLGLIGILATGYEDEGGDVLTPGAGLAASFNFSAKDALRTFYMPDGVSRGFIGFQYSRTLP